MNGAGQSVYKPELSKLVELEEEEKESKLKKSRKSILLKADSEESFKIKSEDVNVEFKSPKTSVFFVRGLSNEVLNGNNSQLNIPQVQSYIEAQFENEQDVE